MPNYLGIDTSNYTTSVAIYSSDEQKIIQQKQLLPVKKGELGLRQSDAVFHHTKQLPKLISDIFKTHIDLHAVSASTRPTNSKGSYMPCFLVGKSVAESISSVNSIPFYQTSHQIGHILAALYSCKRLDLVNEKFLAFHVSGGTTDCLLVEPDKDNLLKVNLISHSLDLKAGQAVDRIGLMLGLNFPCGKYLEELALKSFENYNPKITLKDLNCCLSGLENICQKQIADNISKENVAKYCLDYIYNTIKLMTEKVIHKYGELPLVYVGGVMSNSIIREKLIKNFECYFAEPEFSCDNASGIAIYSALKEK